MSALWAIQFVVTAVCCAFYFCTFNCHIDPARVQRRLTPYLLAVPLKPGQGCIAGPKHAWVGIYWVAPTLLYTVSVRSAPFNLLSVPSLTLTCHPQFGLALLRSIKSLEVKPLTIWKLMLRDGLNLYGVRPLFPSSPITSR